MTKIRRPSNVGTAAQTRAYALRADVLAPQLEAEIATFPATPHGRPALVLVMGLPGVGKSHCARLLCERLGAAHVASDELRSRLFIAASYADAENRAVFAAAAALVDRLLGEGHRVVVDATNLVARNREGAVAVARRRGVPVHYVHVTANDADARDHSDADERIYERMRTQPFEPPAEGYLTLENDAELASGIERVASAIEASS